MSALGKLITWVLGGIASGIALRALARDRGEAAIDREVIAVTREKPKTVEAVTPEDLPKVQRATRFGEPKSRWQTAAALVRILLARFKAHNTTVIAGSLAYYALLALFPAAIAAISVYGLVADPADLSNLIRTISERLPSNASQVISDELLNIAGGSSGGLGVATVIGIAAALWSASAGTKVLITGVNLAYGERENRSFLVLRGLALALTLGMIVGLVIVVSGIAVLPAIVDSAVASISRWPALLGLVIVGLAVLYRIAPSNVVRRNHHVWPGAFTAALTWLAATGGFTFAVSRFGTFGATYGALAGVVVLMLWFFLSGLIVLLGAELNAAIEARRSI